MGMTMTRHHHLNDPAARCNAGRSRGAVLVVTLLALLLLVGLVIWVVNLGQQTSRKVLTQNTADATAAAGAGWVARSFNTVAMNNVAQARMIALVNVLDSMPQSTAFTLTDQRAMLSAVDQGASINDAPFQQGRQLMRTKLEEEVATLEPMESFYRLEFDVRRMTHYSVPADLGGGRGHIWQAMEALDQFSQATMEHLGELAQYNAVRGAQAVGAPAADQDTDLAAFILPAIPDIPWERGEFDDFERPVRMGLLPTAVDDKTTNRGPYDTVFGWRDIRYESVEGYTVPGGTSVARGGRGAVPIGRGDGGNDDRFRRTGGDPDSYRVYGPFQWMIRLISDFNYNRLEYSRLSTHARRIASRKLGMLWPRDEDGDGVDDAQVPVVDPHWITSYNQARYIAAAGEPTIRETAFIAVEIKSRYRRDHPQYGSPGSWAFAPTRSRDRRSPRIVWAPGWQDPESWPAPKVANHVWRDEFDYEVYYDNEIGLYASADDEGEPQVHTVYRIDYFLFGGVNVGDPAEVSNPHNFPSKSVLTAPIDLVHAQIGPDEESRREWLTFLAAARRSDEPLMWPRKFTGHKPYPHMLALAQAHVFNNHSWDLWTQMWHAQLEPVVEFDRWIDQLEADGGRLQSVADLSEQDVQELHRYLASIQKLAPMMSH